MGFFDSFKFVSPKNPWKLALFDLKIITHAQISYEKHQIQGKLYTRRLHCGSIQYQLRFTSTFFSASYVAFNANRLLGHIHSIVQLHRRWDKHRSIFVYIFRCHRSWWWLALLLLLGLLSVLRAVFALNTGFNGNTCFKTLRPPLLLHKLFSLCKWLLMPLMNTSRPSARWKLLFLLCRSLLGFWPFLSLLPSCFLYHFAIESSRMFTNILVCASGFTVHSHYLLLAHARQHSHNSLNIKQTASYRLIIFLIAPHNACNLRLVDFIRLANRCKFANVARSRFHSQKFNYITWTTFICYHTQNIILFVNKKYRFGLE